MGRGLAALLVLVALTGCSATAAPEAGLSPEDLDDYRSLNNDGYWGSTGLGEELRPPAPQVTTVAGTDWAPAFVACMNNSGYDQYVVDSTGGYTVTEEFLVNRTDDELIADYFCSISLEIEGQFEGLLNQAQLDYVFDYYQQSLVPCLGVLGYDLDRVSTREDFAVYWGGWHPYFSVELHQQDAFFADARVPVECPPMPAGMPDPGYSQMWQQL